jgi:3-oxoacyl-[acyl-carrier protein] reductase
VSGALAGRVALVTGGSRGIGRSIALALAQEGADVALAARNGGLAEEAAAEARSYGVKALGISLDVGDGAAVDAAAGTVEKELGKVSILVNNAGITRDQLLLRMKEEDWREVLRVNLDGVFHCTKTFSRDMLRARWGRIINISSVVGLMGNAGQANYAASKAGILGFTRSVARELAGRNVTVNAVVPGYIETDMTGELPPGRKEALLGAVPMGRMGTPEDVARLVVFLSGEDSGYITGQAIQVDGGMVMA